MTNIIIRGKKGRVGDGKTYGFAYEHNSEETTAESLPQEHSGGATEGKREKTVRKPRQTLMMVKNIYIKREIYYLHR